MVMLKPLLETTSARVRTEVLSMPPGDPTPAPRPRHSDSLRDYRTGTAHLVSGVFLALVGVTLTIVGWRHQTSPGFEWALLLGLGPVLTFIGGTFTLISVHKFGVEDETPAGHSFTSRGMNESLVSHGAKTMLRFLRMTPRLSQQEKKTTAEEAGREQRRLHGRGCSKFARKQKQCFKPAGVLHYLNMLL